MRSELSGGEIVNLIIWLGIIFFMGFILGSIYRRPKIYRFPATGWLRVKDYPIPEDIDGFIATDGEEISTESRVNYNSKGVAVMLYKKKEITHWQALPDIPIQNEKLFLYESREEIKLHSAKTGE